MLNISDDLSRAGIIHAVPGDLSFKIFDRLPAYRTLIRRLIYFFFIRPQFLNGADNIGDHITGAFHQDTIANTDVFFFDVIKVMQRCLLDDHTADFYWLENSIRRQHSGSTHIHAYAIQIGGNFFSGKFIRDHTAGILARMAKRFGERKVIYFDNHPVDFKRDLFAVLLPLRQLLNHFINRPAFLRFFRDGKSELSKVI